MLDEATGTQGSVGRFGGEEFIILLPGLLLAEAASLADQIRQRIHTQPLQWGSQAIEWSISAGVVEYGDQDPDFDALVRRADVALYRAKGEGRNRVVSI